MAGLVFGLVSGIVHTVTGRPERSPYHNSANYAPHPSYIYTDHTATGATNGVAHVYAPLPVTESYYPGTWRERKHARRAAKHARKAARWSHGRYPLYASAPAGQQVVYPSYHQDQPQLAQREQPAVATPQHAEQTSQRRASFGIESDQAAPPEYQEVPPRRRSIEVLAATGKN
jgi:hypothetical protein